MQVTFDNELDGTAMIFRDAIEVLDTAMELDPAGERPRKLSAGCWEDMHDINTWSDVQARLQNPWPTGTDFMEQAARLIKANVATPTSIRRQRRWSEGDGEIDCDRAMRGDPAMFHESYRTRRPRVQNVVVLCNMGGRWTLSLENLLWRSACAVVAVDLLEEAGYSCEVWGYTLPDALHGRKAGFLAFPAKQAGSPVDPENIAKILSPWFYRSAVFGAYSSGGKPNASMGLYPAGLRPNRDRWFSRHCNLEGGTERIWMPDADNMYDAIAHTENIIESIENLQHA